MHKLIVKLSAATIVAATGVAALQAAASARDVPHTLMQVPLRSSDPGEGPGEPARGPSHPGGQVHRSRAGAAGALRAGLHQAHV
jgi:hypothetical protein